MRSIFSHIVQKHLSHQNENVATEALAYIINSHDQAHEGLMNLLKAFRSELPVLSFHTQIGDGNIRPDIWGYDGSQPLALIENKFWAGLTDNQPVSYLKHLAEQNDKSILLMVVPEARKDTIWRELLSRVRVAGMSVSDHPVKGEHGYSVVCMNGPLLAITSWKCILDSIGAQIGEDASAESDLLQLRALCCAADEDAFVPFSPEEFTDQLIPTFVMQAISIYETVKDWAVTEDILSTDGLSASNSSKCFGRYVQFTSDEKFGAWFGIHYAFWKRYGESPLWLIFHFGDWGNGQRVQELLDPWKRRSDGMFFCEGNQVLVPVLIPAGEEKDVVLRSVQSYLKKISDVFRSVQKDNE